MLVLSWNCRGLNGDPTGEALRSLVRNRNPDVVFLMETKMSIDRMDLLRKRFGFWKGVAYPANGLAGGLCFWWTRGLNLEVSCVSRNVITMNVRGDDREGDWLLFGIYGSQS